MTLSQPQSRGHELLLPLPPGAGRSCKAAPAAAHGSHGLPLELVSSMLWAGFGLNCHGSGGRAVAGRRGAREVEVYVCLSGGCYRYDACDHALVQVSSRDARTWTGARGPRAAAAVALVYVTEGSDAADTWEETGHIAAADVGAIAGKVAACSTAAGLVARGEEWFHPGLGLLLGLRPRQRIALTQTVAPLPHPTH